MTNVCSACKRSFAEPGFCPYDGTKLAPITTPEGSTVVSAQHAAQSEPQTGGAFGDDTGARNVIHAVSAAIDGDATNALASISRRVSEYDRLIGETLDGRYYVQRKIGEGGMGVVFAVKHTVIERPLAIKVLKKKVMRDQATVKRFIQEARAASRIGHPNIVDVTDFGSTEEGMTYQVMELIDGTTLSKAIKTEAPLPTERVLRIARQIARALVAAHAKGIVHRDLKPENVFLTEREGRPDFVKIVDFGIAKVAPVEGAAPDGPRLTKQGAVFGTPEYMAPEQAAGRSDTDHRVDIYALGTIMYEMIVGRVPHKSSSMVRTIAMQMLDPITPPSKVNPSLNVPPDVEAVLMRALVKNRDERYQTMSDMLVALDGITLDSHTIPDTGPPSMVAPERTSGSLAEPGPRRNKPPTRPLHEPQFVDTPGKPVSFSHVYDDAPLDMERRSRWPMIIAGLLMLLVGAGGTILLIMKLQGGKGDKDKVVTGPERIDAAIVAELADAGVQVPDALAVVDVPPDAGTRVTTKAGRDAGVGGVSGRPTGKGNVTVEVMTRPGEANVFIGNNYRGPSGVKITERFGAKVKIVCKTDRMKGSIDVTFNGELTAVMCNATRDRFCVPGLKNPYDDCEEDPNASP